jgi:hypothetical protein
VATKFLTNLDLNQNQILNGTFEVLASDPATNLFDGRMYYNSTDGVIKVYDSGISAWRKIIAGTGENPGIVSGGSYSNALTITESAGVVTITPNLASSASAGLLSSTFYNDLYDATSDSTANKLVKRDASGNIKVAEPTDPAHAATKGYVDSARSGLDVKQSVKLATNAALPAFTYNAGVITADAVGALSIDGASLSISDVGIRILVKNETSSNAPYNGIYTLTTAGDPSTAFVLTRATDADTNSEVTPGMFTFVEQGSAWADTGWVLSTDGSITLGTTNLSFVQFSAAGQVIAGDGLTKTGNTINVVGTADRITANADSIDIASTYAGQSSITTLGTITTGTWDATTVAVTAGGTGQESFTDNGVIYGNGTGALDVTAAGTQYQVLQAGAGGVPTFGAVDLDQSAAVTGTLGVSNGGTNASTESGARTNLAVGGTQGAGVSTPVLSRTVALTLNGSSTSYTVQHGLGTRDVIVQVYTNGSTYDTVVTDVERTDSNNVTIKFSVAPTSDAYRVVVTG